MKRRVSSKRGRGLKKKTYLEELREAFNVFDVDGDGTITPKELSTIMQALEEDLTEEDIEFMISEIDIVKNIVFMDLY